MKIQDVPVSKIRAAAYNPRKDLKPDDPEYRRLKKAIDQFDLVEPLVWNKRTGNLVGGHQRFKILKERGDKAVTVSVVDLDLLDEKALNLALNKHAGQWDFASLADLVQELDTGDFDMEITGFDESELEKLATWTPPNAGLTDEDAAPEAPANPVTVTGDLWILGKHRVLCGDATVATDVERLLDGVQPGLMVTDPPYGVNYDPDWRNRRDRANGKPYGARSVGLVTNDGQVDWADAYSLFPGAIVYCWHASLHTGSVQLSLERCGFDIRRQVIWAKSRFPISRGHYHWQHESCWYAVKRGATGHWKGDRSQTTLWRIESTIGDEAKNNHSTQKPVECMRRPILNHTNPGQSVYDPFLGSGTTVIAAESSGRVCYGLEISPAYCDVIVKRWEDFTGKKAKRAHETKAKTQARN